MVESPALPPVADTARAQAHYMQLLADAFAAHPDDAVPGAVVVDIAHALAVIGAAAARAEAAPAQAPGKVFGLPMRGRRWRVGHDSGNVFADDDDFDGTTLVIELTSPGEARTVAARMLEIGGGG